MISPVMTDNSYYRTGLSKIRGAQNLIQYGTHLIHETFEGVHGVGVQPIFTCN